MNRLSVMNRIGDLSDQHCNGCQTRKDHVKQHGTNNSQLDGYCSRVCPVGIELRQLGNQLLFLSSAKRGNKKLKEISEMPNVKKPGPKPKDAPSCGLTKQIYIEQIAAGETNASIERAWGMYVNSLYEWVKKWDLKGLKQEAAYDLINSPPYIQDGGKQVSSVEPKQDERQEVDAKVLQEINTERDAIEIKRLSEQLIDAKNLIRDYENELTRWNQSDGEKTLLITEFEVDRDHYIKVAEGYRLELAETNQAIAELRDGQAALLATIEQAVDQDERIVPFHIPITDVVIANVERARIYDAVEALGNGVEAYEIDRERVMRELFDLLQRVVNFVTADLSELHPGKDVTSFVQEFFGYYNQRHLAGFESEKCG